jgi:hypothetical protein
MKPMTRTRFNLEMYLFSGLLVFWAAMRAYFYFRSGVIGFDPLEVPLAAVAGIIITIWRFRKNGAGPSKMRINSTPAMIKRIGAPLILATISALAVFVAWAYVRFWINDPDPSAGPASFIVLFIYMPAAHLAALLGLVALILYFRPSRVRDRNIWRLGTILVLCLPGFAASCFLLPFTIEMFR